MESRRTFLSPSPAVAEAVPFLCIYPSREAGPHIIKRTRRKGGKDSISPSSATAAPRRWSSRRGALVWWCYPRFDGDPMFCRLVAGDEEKGFSDVVLDGMVPSQSEYLRNTAIVTTVLTDQQGGAVRITDFAPRFRNFGRMFRPPQLIRIIEPVSGLPRITIRMRPAHSYGEPMTQRSLGSNHIRYSGGDVVIRLTTDAPLSYIDREAPFVLNRTVSLVLGADEPVPGELTDHVPRVLRPHPRLLDGMGAAAVDLLRLAGRDHPRRDHAQAVQLRGNRRHHRGPHHLDPRGAGLRPHLGLSLLLAARRLFRRQGAQPHRRDADDGGFHLLHPRGSSPTTRRRCGRSIRSCRPTRWRSGRRRISRAIAATGRCGSATPPPCRTSTTPTAASSSSAMPMFFDQRLPRPGDEALFRLLETLGEKAVELALEPDAGIWEFRGRRQRAHPFGGDVLGRRQPARRDRHAARLRRPRGLLERRRRPPADHAARTGVESEAQGVQRGDSAPTTSMPACCCCPSSA